MDIGRTQEYRNGGLVVRFDPKVCIHSGHCVRSLPAVFDVTKHPWVNVNGADAQQIIATVTACPSGALSFERVRKESSGTS